MRSSVSVLAVLSALFGATPATAQFGPIDPAGTLLAGDDFTVGVNAWGVLTQVPASGLVPIDGPTANLGPGFAEWFGVIYETESGHVEGYGPGILTDWAERPEVELISFDVTPEAIRSKTRLEDLGLETVVEFDPDGPHLLVKVFFENLGDELIEEVYYSREWLIPDGPGFVVGPEGINFVAGEVPDEVVAAPASVSRMYFEAEQIHPGEVHSVVFSYKEPSVAQAGVLDVPLAEYTSPEFPDGFVVGGTFGIGWGDFDGDGWIDLMAGWSGDMWRNDEGQGWSYIGNIDAFLPPMLVRYAAVFADYDADGLADLTIEPRIFPDSDDCFHLLRNRGNMLFQDLAGNPQIFNVQPCSVDSETACWGDVDADGDIDLFLPAYPEWVSESDGNLFFRNLGPTGPNGAYRFQEMGFEAGTDNPFLSAKPEGAQLVDVDQDGDLDLFSNGTFYQNVSEPGIPSFVALTGAESGILVNTLIDEGLALFDYDMDGDMDLFIAYITALAGIQLLENRGDGSFFVPTDVVESNLIGLGLGLSYEDWDNDGDIDFTTRSIFRRNMMMETGERKFVVAKQSIPEEHIDSATPAWADWDRDGDLDVAMGNFAELGRLYQNTLYDENTPDEDRRYLRVRPVADSAQVPEGVETEFGAVAEIRILGDDSGLRRRKFTASGHGYLSQSEYTLHFGLPADPLPLNLNEDLRFDLSVDFPSHPSEGIHRVDKWVNPVLGGMHLQDIQSREVTVYRSGAVDIDGCIIDPVDATVEPRLFVTNGGLALAELGSPLPAHQQAPTHDTWIGLDIDTLAGQKLRVSELVLDAQLSDAVQCGSNSANVFLWDVTNPGSPSIVIDGTFEAETSTRNDRTFLPVDFELLPNRVYRMVARVSSFRTSPLVTPVEAEPLRVNGGLAYGNPNGCSTGPVVGANLDPDEVAMSLRYRRSPGGSNWVSLGYGSVGSVGIPTLEGNGALSNGTLARLELNRGAPNSPVLLIAGFSIDCHVAQGIQLLPKSELALANLFTDETGTMKLAMTWPSGIPGGVTIYAQALIVDAGVELGFSASNAVAGTTTDG